VVLRWVVFVRFYRPLSPCLGPTVAKVQSKSWPWTGEHWQKLPVANRPCTNVYLVRINSPEPPICVEPRRVGR